MVLYTIKNLLLIKNKFKKVTSSVINNCIKIRKEHCSRKALMKEIDKMENVKIVLEKNYSTVIFIEPCLWYKNIYK